MTDQKIQQIPTGWKEATLGSVAEIIMGQSPASESYNENCDGLPFYQGITEFNEKYIGIKTYTTQPTKVVEKGTILFSVRAPVGRVNFVNWKCCIGRGNAGLKMKNGQQEFLFYLLRKFEKNIQNFSSGTVFESISGAELRNIEILIPKSDSEQRAIADVLSAFDDKIELLREQNKTLDAIAQTLFNRWFVEFNFPDENGQPYCDSGGKMIDSELGEIPEGWKVGKLGDELEVIMGQSPKGETYNTENDGMEFYQGRADFGERFPTIRLFTTDPMKVAEPMDVLLSVRAPVGEINQTLRKCCIGRGLAAVRSDHRSYAFYRLFNEQEKLKLYEDSGTVFGSITKSAIENIEYVVPSQDIIGQFEEQVHILDQKIFNNHLQIQTLSQIRDSILPKLMRGEVRVKGF